MATVTIHEMQDAALDMDNVLAGKMLADIIGMTGELDKLGVSDWLTVAEAKYCADNEDVAGLAVLRDRIAARLRDERRGRTIFGRLGTFYENHEAGIATATVVAVVIFMICAPYFFFRFIA